MLQFWKWIMNGKGASQQHHGPVALTKKEIEGIIKDNIPEYHLQRYPRTTKKEKGTIEAGRFIE